MQRINELIPPLPVVRERYAANLREATMLHRLMRLAQTIAQEKRGTSTDFLVSSRWQGPPHQNSEAGLYGKFRIPSKPRLLPYSLATFR